MVGPNGNLHGDHNTVGSAISPWSIGKRLRASRL
jgi:hypothetical protein